MERWKPWAAAWPWVAVVVFAAWIGWPLWHAGDRLFTASPRGDVAMSMWFYDYVARGVLAGRFPTRIAEFDWPHPIGLHREFPSAFDAWLAAGAALVSDLPRRWGVVQALALLVNALGAALLARGLGARREGVALAGALGAMTRSTWATLHLARMNVAWPGLVFGAAGAWLLAVRARGWRRLPAAAGALVLGALAVLVYPPFAGFAALAGLPFALGALRRGGWRGVLVGALLVAAVTAIAAPYLPWLARSRLEQPCATEVCPDAYHVLTLSRLALPWSQPGGASIDEGGAWAFTWALAPLALLHRRRWAALPTLAIVGGLVAIGTGPCGPLGDALPFRFWCGMGRLTDHGRPAFVAAGFAAALAGLGVEGLAACFGEGRRALLGRGIAALLAAGTVAWGARTVLSEVRHPRDWRAWPRSEAAAFLARAEAGPVAELPYERSGLFFSVIGAPGRPRLNSIKPSVVAPPEQPFLHWVDALGRLDIPDAPPPAGSIADSGLRWVIFDEARCSEVGARAAACAAEVPAALREVLGPPEQVGGLLVWDVQRASEAVAGE